jgi:iron complex transport system ATP-binding protein
MNDAIPPTEGARAEPGENAVKAEAVAFAYRPGHDVLHAASLEARVGELTCILGPNGCGKTTLLKCLMNRLRPHSGAVEVGGRPVAEHSPRQLARLQAYVPQIPETTFAFTVTEIVLMGRFAYVGLLGITEETDLAIASEAMRMTRTHELASRTLDELSGGEAQRVMIARALAQQPRVMLLDEPTSHLDIRNQLMIHSMLARVAHDWPMCVLCVSHDINLAARFSDRLLIMREGRTVAAGPPGDVIKKDILQEAYQVEIELVDAGGPVPLVVAV